jgi:hypothetical protein
VVFLFALKIQGENLANVCLWHFAAFAAPQTFVGYWDNNGQTSAQGLNG